MVEILKKTWRWCFVVLSSLCCGASVTAYGYEQERHIVIIIPSFENKDHYQANLDSVFSQNYENYHVIYIDDASTDRGARTGQLVEAYIDAWGMRDRVTIIHNAYNRKALMNIYQAVHSCDDDDLVVVLDGDDAFAHDHVLKKINRVHADDTVWLSYAQYINVPPLAALEHGVPVLGYAAPTPQAIIDQKNYRWCYQWLWSGLRSFRAWFFKCIKLESLFFDMPPYQGKLCPIMYDAAIMWPMMEMGGNHVRHIPDILLNRSITTTNDFAVAGEALKEAVRNLLRNQEVYPTVDNREAAYTLQGRQENTGVATLILSYNRPERLAALLAAINAGEYPGLTTKSSLVCYETTGATRIRYKELVSQYPEVTFIKVQHHKPVSEALVACLTEQGAHHIVCMSDRYELDQEIDWQTAATQLERTYAYAVYSAVALDDFVTAERTMLPELACEQLDGDLCGWQFCCWMPRNWHQHALTPTLYRVRDLISSFASFRAQGLQELVIQWQQLPVDNRQVGLFYGNARTRRCAPSGLFDSDEFSAL